MNWKLWMGALALGGMTAGAAGSVEDGASAERAFEALKGFAGRWEGHVITPDGPKAVVEYRVSAGGKTVLEILFPGTDHEMLSVYYLDGRDLVAKHFCSMGNQPEMKLDAQASGPAELRFAFTGGTNLDPAVDTHIHDGRISLLGDRLESEWAAYTAGKPEGSNRFFLERAQP